MTFTDFPDSNVPIAGTRIPPLYSYGLNVHLNTTAPDTMLDLHEGVCCDRYDNIDMFIPETINLNAAVVGVNGMDTGALGASTFYYIYVIGSSNGFKSPAGLISASREDPILPTGYDSYRMIDIKVTDGDSDFLLTYTDGSYKEKTFLYDTPIDVHDAAGSLTWDAISLAAVVAPSLSTPMVQFISNLTPNTAANILYLRPTGSSSTDGFTSMNAPVVSVVSVCELNCFSINAVPSIDYKTTEADDAFVLSIKSFTYNI